MRNFSPHLIFGNLLVERNPGNDLPELSTVTNTSNKGRSMGEAAGAKLNTLGGFHKDLFSARPAE